MNCGLKITLIPRWISVGVDLNWTTGQVETSVARSFFSFIEFSWEKTFFKLCSPRIFNFTFLNVWVSVTSPCTSATLNPTVFSFHHSRGPSSGGPLVSLFSATHLVSLCLMSAGVWEPGGPASLWTSVFWFNAKFAGHKCRTAESHWTARLCWSGPCLKSSWKRIIRLKPSTHDERDSGTVELQLKGSLVHISTGLSSEQDSVRDNSNLGNLFLLSFVPIMNDGLINSTCF